MPVMWIFGRITSVIATNISLSSTAEVLGQSDLGVRFRSLRSVRFMCQIQKS